MKKIVFTFMTVFALALMANSVKAQTAITPYQGGTYTYTLSGVKVLTEGTVTIDLLNGTSWSVVGVSDQVGPLASITATQYTVPTTSTSLIFEIKYNDDETVGSKTLNVILAEGDANGCFNFINLDVTVTAKPTLELVLASPNDNICQTVNNTNNNEAGSLGAITIFAFTVTPNFSTGAVAEGATYDYEFDLDDYAIGTNTITIQRTGGDGSDDDGDSLVSNKISVTGATDTQTFEVRFFTTTGLSPEDIIATISNGVLTAGGSGSATYDATYNPETKTVSVSTTPSIGSFTW